MSVGLRTARAGRFTSAPPARVRLVSAKSPDAIEKARRVLRSRHYSPATVKVYLFWIERFLRFHSPRETSALREPEVNEFLSHLAERENVAASTQNQALCALLLFYDQVVGNPLDRIEGVVRARRPKTRPTVLSKDEVDQLLSELDGTPLLIAQLLYGSGLRLNEALSLRVKDVDFRRGARTRRSANRVRSQISERFEGVGVAVGVSRL